VRRSRGKGLPEFGSGRGGDLYLRMQVRVPERLSHEERDLYERLRALCTVNSGRGRSRARQ
jgi:molecular chaperone DnaJ